jgi:hypothetical protein
VDGDLTSLNSFRAELEAIRSLLYWLRLLIKVYSFTRPSDWHVVIWIDNSSALKYSKLDDFFKPNQHIGNESDIINDIFAVKTELQISLRGKHVKSHQTIDRNVRAPLEVQLNEGCDSHADDFLKKSPPKWRSAPTATIPATAKATLIIKNAVITNNYLQRLTDAWSATKMRKYLQDGQGWTDDTFHSVDWDNFETAITKTFKKSKTDFSRYVKFMIDMANTGAQKEKFTSKSSTAPTASNKCPCCKTAIETTLHLYNCKPNK